MRKIPCLLRFELVIAVFCFFISHFRGCLSQISFHEVRSCPVNKISWNAKSDSFHCGVESSAYHCMRTASGGFAEFCMQRQGLRAEDGCPIIHTTREGVNIIQDSCRKTTMECPESKSSSSFFSSDELYKYPACLENENAEIPNLQEHTTAKHPDKSAHGTDTNSQQNLTLIASIAVVSAAVLLAIVCGLVRYVRRLKHQVQDATYLPSVSWNARNSHQYGDVRVYDSIAGLERGQCAGAEGEIAEKDIMVIADDTGRISCARNTLYDYIGDAEGEQDGVAA